MKKLLLVPLVLTSINASAGIWGPTAHSRANCLGNNESITWHLNHPFDWRVESHHIPDGWSYPHHIVNTGHQYTWRCAAVHWRESRGGKEWSVIGYHFYYNKSRQILDVLTAAEDCNIYDGWWDY